MPAWRGGPGGRGRDLGLDMPWGTAWAQEEPHSNSSKETRLPASPKREEEESRRHLPAC